MIVVASANGDVGIAVAIEILRDGGSAIDAVVAATELVELNANDHSVGLGGYPNLLGHVELDASIMEGSSRRAGAVAAQGYLHPIAVARALMETLPQHLLLTGDGAARFAAERGFPKANLLTQEAEDAWRRKIALDSTLSLTQLVAHVQDPEKTVGTVNFIAQDSQGQIASAVSTSGWAFKYPGRVGDSPIIGAGNYCDNRFGACACTGLGEWAIRSGTARLAVFGMQQGLTLAEACAQAMLDLQTIPLPADLERIMNLVAIDRNGGHAGFTTIPGRTYIWQTPEMDMHEVAMRTVVAAKA